LVLSAVELFGARPYAEVTVGDLAGAADVTTGALYHHFQNKLGLYRVVRTDVEQRLLDRMTGAAAGRDSFRLRQALVVGFDFAVDNEFTRILGEAAPYADEDRVAEFLSDITRGGTSTGRVLAATWRASVLTVTDAESAAESREVLARLGAAF
jgi:AcrR family transcriptional regulator